MVTSSPVVGSSITIACGLQDRRHGDRHPLLLAARELVRVAAQETGSAGSRTSFIVSRIRVEDRSLPESRRVHLEHLAQLAADPQAPG